MLFANHKHPMWSKFLLFFACVIHVFSIREVLRNHSERLQSIVVVASSLSWRNDDFIGQDASFEKDRQTNASVYQAPQGVNEWCAGVEGKLRHLREIRGRISHVRKDLELLAQDIQFEVSFHEDVVKPKIAKAKYEVEEAMDAMESIRRASRQSLEAAYSLRLRVLASVESLEQNRNESETHLGELEQTDKSLEMQLKTYLNTEREAAKDDIEQARIEQMLEDIRFSSDHAAFWKRVRDLQSQMLLKAPEFIQPGGFTMSEQTKQDSGVAPVKIGVSEETFIKGVAKITVELERHVENHFSSEELHELDDNMKQIVQPLIIDRLAGLPPEKEDSPAAQAMLKEIAYRAIKNAVVGTLAAGTCAAVAASAPAALSTAVVAAGAATLVKTSGLVLSGMILGRIWDAAYANSKKECRSVGRDQGKEGVRQATNRRNSFHVRRKSTAAIQQHVSAAYAATLQSRFADQLQHFQIQRLMEKTSADIGKSLSSITGRDVGKAFASSYLGGEAVQHAGPAAEYAAGRAGSVATHVFHNCKEYFEQSVEIAADLGMERAASCATAASD